MACQAPLFNMYFYFLGLSYRKGLTWARSKNPQEMLHLHPLDLRSALSIVSSSQEAESRLVIILAVDIADCLSQSKDIFL